MTTSGVVPRALRAVRVLFVDGDADTRFAYQSLATSEGLCAELARDGHEAIALASVFVPDVIVLAVWLSGFDGFEVACLLRNNRHTDSIPIILVSDGNNDRIEADARTSGCEGYLAKPFSAEALLKLVKILAMGRRDLSFGENAPGKCSSVAQ